MAGAWRGSIHVEGLAETQRAFRRIGGDLPKVTRKALREIAVPVRSRAKANIQHKTGRHGDPSLPHLASTIRIGVKAGSVSVYSDQPYAWIQDQGGRVGHGAVVSRASASAYMTRAVEESGAETATALEHLGDAIETKFEGG